MIGRHCLRQREVEEHCVSETECCRKDKRHLNAPTAQDAADRWSKDKSETKRGADQPHSFGAVLFGGDVGDVGLRGGDVSAGDAVEDATDKKHKDAFGESEYEKADAGADDREQEHRSPAVFVRQTSQHW